MFTLFRLRIEQLILMGFLVLSSQAMALQNVFPNSRNEYTTVSNIAAKNYAALQQALTIYENAASHPLPTLSSKLLKPGMKSIAVMALRSRLEATGELSDGNNSNLDTYDDNLMNAVMVFQSNHGLNPDGVVGSDTRAALNVPISQRIIQIQVNMARWSKLSGELGDHYILVNIPAYKLDLVENGNTVLTMKAIVGKPTRPTPEIESTVTRVVFNPYWNVPKLIAQRDIIPKILNDPGYLDEMNIKILNREDEDNSYEISASDIDWSAAEEGGFQYHFRQEPGENNALGLVKFEFQNSHDVYMHDTPAKELFDAEKRDFSSGCIRLEKPFDLVTYLLGSNPNWSEERMQSILEEGKTSYIKIARPMPVIIAYLTAWVDDQGQLQFRDDVYGWDQPDPPSELSEPEPV